MVATLFPPSAYGVAYLSGYAVANRERQRLSHLLGFFLGVDGGCNDASAKLLELIKSCFVAV